MAAGRVNDGVEFITDRHIYDAYIRIYQNIPTTLSRKRSQAQVTIRLTSQVVRPEEENSKFGVDKKNQLDVTFCILYFLLIVAQHVSGNRVPIIRS
jgi:hypothetical protein